MIYMSPRAAANDKKARWGRIITPNRQSDKIEPGTIWCMDNGVFTGKFSATRFWKALDRMAPYRATCVFVVAPDTVANAIATMDQFRHWGPRIKEKDYPVAFVAQDGAELFPFPPRTEFDALFIGGTTEWKMSKAALECIARAQALGKWVHVGRVNSQRRIRHFQIAGVDSVDGTSLCFAPTKNMIIIEKQLRMRPLFVMGSQPD